MQELEIQSLVTEKPVDSSTRTEDSFLQSLEWEEIQRRYGRETRRVLVGTSPILCVKNDLRFGLHYWYAPRPFIYDGESFLKAAKELAKETLFFRVEPLNELPYHLSPNPYPLAPNLQPKETILMDLSKSGDELLAAMHPKTRYNIRVAERHGVIIEMRDGKKALDDFYSLLLKTADRDQFSLHPRSYYECLLFLNSQEFENRLFFAIHHGEIAAAAMINFYCGTATYLHGASNYALRHVMAPYALHWEIMKAARVQGCHTYDFGGIDEVRWPGVTRFKKGFGGGLHSFPAALDIASHWFRYFAYQGGRFLTSMIKRGIS